jgi:hypothetical protein
VSNLGTLGAAIVRLAPCEDAAHVSTAPVKDVFQGKTVWEGDVEVFMLTGHPKAERCYAWAYRDSSGKTHYTVVLELPQSNPRRMPSKPRSELR